MGYGWAYLKMAYKARNSIGRGRLSCIIKLLYYSVCSLNATRYCCVDSINNVLNAHKFGRRKLSKSQNYFDFFKFDLRVTQSGFLSEKSYEKHRIRIYSFQFHKNILRQVHDA